MKQKTKRKAKKGAARAPAVSKSASRVARIPGRITQWSFSRYTTYESCPYRAALKFVLKLREPSSPAMARGEQVHKDAENFVRGTTDKISPELQAIAKDLRRYRRLAAKPELQLAVTREWSPTGWFDHDVWCRIKIDALAMPAKTPAEAVDYKTGRYKPDDPDYERQLELYATGVMSVEPKPKQIKTRLLFTDHGTDVVRVYSRDQLAGLRKTWEKRVEPMLSDALFPPRPGRVCMWCHFRKSNGGPCDY